jgi:hypothetical protein
VQSSIAVNWSNFPRGPDPADVDVVEALEVHPDRVGTASVLNRSRRSHSSASRSMNRIEVFGEPLTVW